MVFVRKIFPWKCIFHLCNNDVLLVQETGRLVLQDRLPTHSRRLPYVANVPTKTTILLPHHKLSRMLTLPPTVARARFCLEFGWWEGLTHHSRPTGKGHVRSEAHLSLIKVDVGELNEFWRSVGVKLERI